MKEDKFVVSNGRLEHIGLQRVEHRERDPNKVWIGTSHWYLDLANFSVIHDEEQLATDYAVDPSVLMYTDIVTFGECTPEGRRIKAPTVTWFEISNNLLAEPDFRFAFCSQPEKLEHFIAAAHWLEGYGFVTVTPRSGDRGRDVIAEQHTKRLLRPCKKSCVS